MKFFRWIWLVTLVLSINIGVLGCSQSTQGSKPDKVPPEAKTACTVDRVVDGDTFATKINGKDEKVRLIGVNTPESVKPGESPQPFGKEAAEYTKKMLSGKKVYLAFDVQDRDKYGRLLAYVYLEDGTFYNLHIVQEGYAQVMTIPPNVKFQDRLLAAQKEAKQKKKGLWGL